MIRQALVTGGRALCLYSLFVCWAHMGCRPASPYCSSCETPDGDTSQSESSLSHQDGGAGCTGPCDAGPEGGSNANGAINGSGEAAPSNSSSGPESRPVIVLTGYWDPTGQMLAQFSRDSSLNPQGWQGSNWEGRGYDVVSFFPDPEGYVGDFEVDYQDTWKDFDRVVEEWNPIAIMAHGRGVGPWELEVRARNLDHWGDDPTPPSQPIPNPPDSTVDAGVARQSTLPNDEIAEAVNQLDLEGIGPTGAWVNEDGNAGGYLCEYMAYLVMWHQAVCASEGTCDCLMAGFTHVGSNVPIASGERATEAALRVLIEALDEQRR